MQNVCVNLTNFIVANKVVDSVDFELERSKVKVTTITRVIK